MLRARQGNNEPVERFLISGEDGYSEFWRRDKSPIESLELGKLLVALRKIASYVGRNVGTVVWAGMDYQHGIALDPTFVMGEYPIPSYKTDIIAGLTVRRAYEKTEWSEKFKREALSQISLSPDYSCHLDLCDFYFSMCEKVYFDCLSNGGVLGLYTEKARQWEIAEKSGEFVQPPTVSELLYIWWGIAADRSGTKYQEEYAGLEAGDVERSETLKKFYGKPVSLLNSIVGSLIHECPKLGGVTERGNFRRELYLSIWPGLLEYVGSWPDTGKCGEEGTATILGCADKIETVLGRRKPDFTEKVKANVKNVDDVVRIKSNDIITPARNAIDKTLLHKLKLVIRDVAQRKTSYNRGLKSGKIDHRRLYRAPTTGAVFQLRKNKFELVNDIVVLVDATESMSDPNKWGQAQATYQTLFAALKEYNSNARIFAYNEVKDACRLTEIHRGKDFYTVLPHGKTASGEAILAVAMSLRVRNKKPFIIHITDGASNWGCGVSDAIAFCRKRRINLLTLGMGCAPGSKQLLRKEYENLVQFVSNIDELPVLLRSLLNHSKWS